jgi:hypothetical protein
MKQLFAVLSTLTLACGSPHRPPAAPAPQDSFAIVVINHHWLDVTVYLVHDGQRTRVGTVTATTTQQFDLSARLLGATRRVSLIGEAVGSKEAVRTETLTLQPGQYIEWTLENALQRSSVALY